MGITEISDLSAPELAAYVSLTGAQLRNKLEPEKGIFIAESPKVIELALDSGYEIISLLTEKKFIDGQAGDIIRRCPDIPVYTAEREVLASLTGYTLTRGVLAEMKRPVLRSPEEVCRNGKRIAVLEDIADSTNVGAVFRSAAALGIDAVLITPSCCDPLCRRSVRVSMGTVLLMPWSRICDTPEEWHKSGIERLHSLGFKCAAMALSDNSVSIDDKALLGEERLALIIGTEGTGLAADTIEKSDYTVKIPMSRGVDSLNAAAAAAVAFWAVRSGK